MVIFHSYVKLPEGTIHCWSKSTSKEWDNLGFGLTTKDTNMVGYLVPNALANC